MVTALVTGATGFVGNAVARALIDEGKEVRVLSRKSSNRDLLKGLKAETFLGDLRHPQSLHHALEGCDELYHVAAQYTFYNPQPQEIYGSNVEGTRNILQAALDQKLKRVVYTSTVGTIGIPKDGSPGNENTTLTLEECQGHYKRSKFLAEQEAIQFAKRGLNVVIVNPSAPIGVRDIKPTPTGKLIVDFLNGKMPAFIDTGLNLVDVEDVAQGHLLAAKQGRAGERYILGNQNLSLKQILQILSGLTGLKAPRWKIPYSVAWSAAQLSEALAKITQRAPAIELEAVLLGKKKMFFSANKAVKELNLPQTNVKIALKKAVDWYLENNYIKPKIKEKILGYQANSSFDIPAPVFKEEN
ncbi:MAG: NAD-dependent epimerase/dehydratase family protein [Deltaproteobacteria bacterium]|nr:NAD-dependent epimerase/dehydratase family protein [Deltaproteobacteria bacterium]